MVLSTDNNNLEYLYGGIWEQEKDGIKSIADFKKYLEQKAKQLGVEPKLEIL